MSVHTRLHLENTSDEQLRQQWMCSPMARDAGSGRLILLRTVAEDPLGRNHLASIAPRFEKDKTRIDVAWSEAQLAADMTILGRAVGMRVALVLEDLRFCADLIGLPKRSRLRLGRGSRSPLVALRSLRRQLVATIVAETSSPDPDRLPRLRVLDADGGDPLRMRRRRVTVATGKPTALQQPEQLPQA